jgi:hypothetical protein
MSILTMAVIAAAVMALSAMPAMAAPNQKAGQNPSWGQAVNDCNQRNCYPGGTERGTYVKPQAQDTESPGYGNEIQNFANPGQANPKSF